MKRNLSTLPLGLRIFIVLFVVFRFFIPDSAASSPPHKISDIQYPQVVVTAKRVPVPQDKVVENVTVYTQEDIRKLPAHNLTEFLSQVPGVDVQLNGQFGQASNLSINGSPARHVLLMVDGIPFNTQLSGQANPTQIPLEHIERIEIIKGASSSVWGSSLGGVVNIITKKTGNSRIPEGTFKSSFAEFNTTRSSLDLAGKIGEWGYYLSGSDFHTDGILDETDTTGQKAFTKLSHPLGDMAHMTGSFGYSGADVQYGVTRNNTVVGQPYVARYGQVRLDVDQAAHQWQIAYKYNNQRMTTDTTNASTGARVSSITSENVYQGISLGDNIGLGDHSMVLGADFDWHTLKSNQYLSEGKNISMQAPYALYTLSWGKWDFIPGLRYDHNQQFGSQLSPSWGMVYHFDDSHGSLLRTKIARAFNAPPLLWIFNNDPSQMVGPNPDLKAERAMVYEFGFETNLSPRVNMDLNLYRAEVKDGIALTFDASQSVFIQRNFRKLIRQGGEVIFTYEPDQSWSFYAGGGFNDVFNASTKQMVRDQGITRHKFNFGAEYRTVNGWRVNLFAYYNRWASAPSLRPNDRKPILNLICAKNFVDIRQGIDVEAFFNVHNVTNSKYWSSITYPLAERYFEGGFAVRW